MTFYSIKKIKYFALEWLSNRFSQLIIYPSIWVAAAIASLGIYTQKVLELDFNWQPIALIFTAALIPYNLDRIIDSYVQIIPDRKAQLFFRKPCIWVLLFTAIFSTGFLLYNAPRNVQYASIVGIVPLLYGTPVFPWKQESEWQWYRLKDIPGSKAWIVGSILTYAVVVLPIAYTGISLDLTSILITAFLFVFIVTNSHIFDIRDLESDRHKGVVTLPIIVGIRGTKTILSIMNLLVLIIIIIAWLANIIVYRPEIILATGANLIYIWLVDTNTPRWVYSIWIEGCLFIPILVTQIIKLAQYSNSQIT